MTASRASVPEPAAVQICLTGTADALVQAGRGSTPIAAHPSVRVMIVEAAEGAPDKAALLHARAVAERHDLAFILENDSDLALDIQADGVQIAWHPDDYARSRAILGADRSIGCMTSTSRHEAMTAAEAGADFIGLSVASAQGEPSAEAVEFVAWWSALFEVPIVAQGAADRDTIMRLKEARPEFIALSPELWTAEVMDLFSG